MRSRLEARWASMFDTLHWRWEYEPDLQIGFVIPDFVLVGLKHPVIVECKPALTVEELARHRRHLIGKLCDWLRHDVLREIAELDHDPGSAQLDVDRAYYDLIRVSQGRNPRGRSRRVLVVGSTLHVNGNAVTVDGEHGFCVCGAHGEPDHVGLTAALGEHCLVCGTMATGWLADDAILGAWRESQNDVQWQPT